jgi:hypothetical protein
MQSIEGIEGNKEKDTFQQSMDKIDKCIENIKTLNKIIRNLS